MDYRRVLTDAKSGLLTCLFPASAVGKQAPSLMSLSFLLPMLSTLLLTLQQTFDKALTSLDDPIDAAMRLFLGFCVGAVIALLSALFLFALLRIYKISVSYTALLYWVDLCWFLPLCLSAIGTLLHLIFGFNTFVVFGLSSLLLSLTATDGVVRSLVKKHENEELIRLIALFGCGVVSLTAVGLMLNTL